MKEIGGYIELEYNHGKEYHQNAIALNCGRKCLSYMIEAFDIKKIYIPFFLCSSVSEVCKKNNVEIVYYHINEDFTPIIPDTYTNDAWFYLVNYYGQISNEYINRFCSNINNLIVDNAQAFFQMPVDNIPTIYTCRKFFGVPDGSYLYNSRKISRYIEQDISYERMTFLLGRLEKTANEFYSDYSNNNKQFNSEPVKTMSKLTKNLLCGIDYNYVKKQRTENFEFLESKLEGINKLNLKIPEGPFAYPLYIANGSEIRKKLQLQKIYIPTLWPDVFELCDESMLEYDLAKNTLPIPIDQRYCKKEMEYLFEFLNNSI